MPRVLIWQVTGMTCTSCENIISDVLKTCDGVLDVEVSVKKSKAAIRLRDGARDPDLARLNRNLAHHGYCLFPKGCALPSSREPLLRRARRALPALLLVGFALFLLSPLRKFVPSISAGASVGAVFLLGIVASLSTCLASTGGFMLAYSAEAGSKRKTILMHLGRVIAFGIGGAFLGALGGALPAGSSLWYGVLGILLGIGFLAVALNLLELSPSLAQMGIALPSSLHAYADRLRKRPGATAPVLVGAVTFLLPCGFTQTAQAIALASGSATRGAMILLAFALGTLPVLLGLTSFATKATLQHHKLRLAVGAALLFFAFGQIESGLVALGSPVTFAASGRLLANVFSRSATAVTAVNTGDMQLIKMDVTSYGYAPNAFTVQRGVPVRWEINGIDVAGCGSSIVSRPLRIAQRLTPGLNVIEFTPTEAGTIPFSCAMGMIRGTFTVI